MTPPTANGSTIRVKCGRYDRTAALADGRVTLPGFVLDVEFANAPSCFRSVLRPSDIDVAEMSFSYYAVMRDRGDDSWTALPVFLSRAFRHSSLYVRARPEPVVSAGMLRGRTIGIEEYHMTAAVWIRALLEDDFGIRPEEVEWVIGPVSGARREPMQEIEPPPGISIRDLDGHATLIEALRDGAVDAVISPFPPPGARGPIPTVARLLPDWRQREVDYHSRTGHFPIMHLVAVRRSTVERNPGLASALFDAFSRARDLALADLDRQVTPVVSVPFLDHAIDLGAQAFPAGAWPYGVAPNEATIVALQQYLVRQGLTRGVLPLESFFAAGSATTPPRRL